LAKQFGAKYSQIKLYKGEIDLLELVKLKELDCFFFARKFEDTAYVSVADYNKNKLKNKVNILSYNDKILLKQRNLNNKIYAEILATAKENNEKPCYRVVTSAQVEKLQSKGLEFAYFLRDDGSFNIVFNKNIEQKINAELKSATLKLS
jgi:hypothetical protein